MYFIYYLILINIVGAIIFALDKYKAQSQKRRIPEKTLHIFEFLGACFSIIPMMYLIRHKNQKASYYLITFAAGLVWASLIILKVIF